MLRLTLTLVLRWASMRLSWTEWRALAYLAAVEELRLGLVRVYWVRAKAYHDKTTDTDDKPVDADKPVGDAANAVLPDDVA